VRTPRGEVDVLALDGETVAVVEVKATSSTTRVRPQHRLRLVQRRRLQAAGRWLQRRGDLRGRRLRFDVVAVVLGGGRPRVTIHRGWF
jgi:putative endonuclease